MLRYALALFLLSAAVIAFELALMQVFSITQWHHFAYMVISVAMLGFGAAGTVLALFENRWMPHFERAFPLLMLCCGVAMALVCRLAQHSLVRFDTYLIFQDYRQVGRLLATYLIFFLPFFLAALAIGMAFVRFSRQIGKLYFADLLGSGLGGLLGVGLLWAFFPSELPALLALLPFLAGMITLPWAPGKRWWIGATVVFAIILHGIVQPPGLQPSQYKSLSNALLLPEAAIEVKRSSPYGLMEVVSAPALRYAPALSLKYTGKVPPRKALFNNGEWAGTATPRPAPGDTLLFDYTAGALPFRLRRPETVLLLNAGTGEQAAHALARQASAISFVEPNPVIPSLLKRELAKDTDSLLFHPAITIHELEARTFLMADTHTYHLILLPTVNTFGGTAGLHAMQEQYLLTTEAFREMWGRLSPDGMLSISCWLDYPARDPLKLLATLAEVLAAEGVKAPRKHLIAIRSWGTITFVLKKEPVTEEEARATRAFCEEMAFDPFLLPGLLPGEQQVYNQLQDSLLFRYAGLLLSPARDSFCRHYAFNIRPASDEQPYFSQFLRWKSLPMLSRQWGSRNLPFLEIGYLIVWLTFFQIFLTALALSILPLFRIGFRSSERAWSLLYFGSLGLGFMFVEIVLIQQFTLFMGKPIFATALVISGLLTASGAGSWYASRWHWASRKLWRAPLLAALLITAYAAFLLPELRGITGLPTAVKTVLLLLLLAPLGFLMGMPFPLGIRRLADKGEGAIPWAWGINGYCSVISTALAAIIAAEVGFFVVMVLAAAAYATAALASRQKRG